MGGLLGGILRREVVRRCAVLRVGDGRLVARLDRRAAWRAAVIIVACFADAVCLLSPRCLRLLALRGGDTAFDGEGGAIGARDTQRGGVASYLRSVTIASYGVSYRDYSLCASGMLFALLAFVAIIIVRPRCRGSQAKL